MKTRKPARGVAIVEFALIVSVFFMLLIGIMEMGRVMFYWNTATELTRLGARVAVVCDIGSTAVASRMSNLYPLIPASSVLVDYSPSGCTQDTCEEVTVRVAAGVPINTFIPFLPLSLSLPEFRTTLPRESLRSVFQGVANPVCE